MSFFHCSLLSLSLFTLFLTLVSAQKKCRALVLQGGGDKGAYETGVLNGFIYNAKNLEDFQYDVITGISVGALNGICLAQFAKGDEVNAVDYLTAMWSQTKRNDVFVDWPGGILEGLLLKSSLYNNNPELNYLNKNILLAPNLRKMTMVATDLNTGAKIVFNERDWNNSESIATTAALYSSAVPVVFMDRNADNHTYIDGGWSGEGLDIEDAIARCLEIVDDEKDIIIDAILASNISYTSVHAESYNSLEVLFRYHRIQSYMSSARAITYGKTDYPDVDFRYIMIPSEPLPNQDVPLDFNPDNIQYMLQLGQKDAIMALREGPEAGMKSLEESMKLHRFK